MPLNKETKTTKDQHSSTDDMRCQFDSHLKLHCSKFIPFDSKVKKCQVIIKMLWYKASGKDGSSFLRLSMKL